MSDGIPLPPPGGTPERIGKYRILRQIAQGGMAEIYLASASGIEGFEKLCVLKRILPLLASNREFVQMFLDEARIAASLLHSNIAQVFDIGEDRGSYYFVMEFMRGQDVRQVLQGSVDRNTFIAFEHITTIITGVCAGLHHAHEMRGKDGRPLQLVHRDISPQNVFVTHEGGVKLCDFGVAKSAAQLTETRVGTLKGKIRYMSPEQCRSEPLDRRSDVFALSIVLWELVTLRRLFTGKSDFDVFKAIVEEPLPLPSQMRRDVPTELERIIMKGLSRERDDRFQSAQELQLALEDWARNDRIPASSVRLGAFMIELFGPPEPDVESYLEKTTDADPMARRLRPSPTGAVDTPHGDTGPLGVLPLPRSNEFVDDDIVETDAPIMDEGFEEPTDASARRGPGPTKPMRVTRPPEDEGAPADEITPPVSAPLSLDLELAPLSPTLDHTIRDAAAIPLARPAPRLLVGLAVLVCAAAIATLLLRGHVRTWWPAEDPRATPSLAPLTPPPVMPTASSKTGAVDRLDPLPAPSAPEIEPAPSTPAEEPAAATAPVLEKQAAPIARPVPSRAPVRRSAPKKAEPAKKRGSLDDFLPP